MRSIRRAAVAGAAALALTVSGMSVASAEEDVQTPATGNASLSSQIGEGLDASENADRKAFFPGSAGLEEGEEIPKIEDQPAWSKVLFAGTIIGTIGSILGLVVGPIVNFINHG